MGGNFFPASSRPARLLVYRLVFRLVSCVPWGVLFFLSGRLSLLARIVLIRLVWASRFSSRLTCSFRSSYCVSGGVSPYPRVSAPPSCHIILPGRFACSSRFFPIRLSYLLADLDRAFLRGVVLPYHPDGCVARSLVALTCSLRNRCAVSVPVLRHPVMRR